MSSASAGTRKPDGSWLPNGSEWELVPTSDFSEAAAVGGGTHAGGSVENAGEMALVIEPAIQRNPSGRLVAVGEFAARNGQPDMLDVVAGAHVKQAAELPLQLADQ